jgi:hypothetical protein
MKWTSALVFSCLVVCMGWRCLATSSASDSNKAEESVRALLKGQFDEKVRKTLSQFYYYYKAFKILA